MKYLILAAPLLLLGATLPAQAHDDDYDSHAADHREHYRFHDEINEAHERAHDEGFSSRREHRAYHRALRDLHGDFHEDHPNTYHDHYRYYRPYRRWWWAY